MTQSLEEELGSLLKQAHLTIAVAEGCTGGMVGHRITQVPGASAYFLGGIIAYGYGPLTDLLGIQQSTLETFGAVSREISLAMAYEVRMRIRADIGLSTCGVLGPYGGTQAKPVGTTWIGLVTAQGSWSEACELVGNRYENKEELTARSLQYVLSYIKGEI